ncbi:MAG: ribonuclease III [Clostridiales bacterium]|nr:ribonuclease III [Clostridiales bacterium]
MTDRDVKDTEELEKKIGYKFEEPRLLKNALTHSSYANESRGDIPDNERLEFLGDSVLGMIIASYLYNMFKEYKEGNLTRMRAGIVSEVALAEIARGIDLGHFLYLGRGESNSGGRDRDSVLADAMEAIIGAVYLEGGLAKARELVINLFKPIIDRNSQGRGFQDYKTLLQEELQRNGDKDIAYNVVAERGPDHSKTFVIQVSYDGKIIGKGKGRSKKEAEQQAAKRALENI